MTPENPVQMRFTFRTEYLSAEECIWTQDLISLDGLQKPQITRKDIETNDTTRLIQDLRADHDNPLVKVGPGTVILSIESNEENPSQVFLKRDFRAFIKKANKKGICWIYFAKPGSGWLRIILAASESGSQITGINNQLIQMSYIPEDFYVFFATQFRRYYILCELAGISLEIANAHLKSLIEPLFPMLEVVPHYFRHEQKFKRLENAYRSIFPEFPSKRSFPAPGEMIKEIF